MTVEIRKCRILGVLSRPVQRILTPPGGWKSERKCNIQQQLIIREQEKFFIRYHRI